MKEEIVKNAILCLSHMKIEDITYQVARDIVIDELIERNKRIDKALEFLDGYEDMVGLTGTLVYNLRYILQGKDKGEDK